MFFAIVAQYSWIAATKAFLKGERGVPRLLNPYQSRLSALMNEYRESATSL